MASSRDDFTKDAIEIIASRVGYKCSYPNCRVQTRGAHTNSEKRVSVGEAAHITAASPGGPRYDPTLTVDQRKSDENGIWMCKTHARLVDADAINYPIQLLRRWKYGAENEQYCIINNIDTVNLKRGRHSEALRKVGKSINRINSTYECFKKYYDENLSMFSNFIEVNNKAMEM